MRTIVLVSVTITLMTCFLACSDRPDQSASVTPPSATDASQSDRSAIAASVMDRAALQRLIESHQGQAVVLHLWALW
jgi:hypothetical protein